MIKTKARIALLALFNEDPTPLSAQEIRQNLERRNITVNKTTIYRELDFLLKEHVVREVMWDDSVVRYEKDDPHCHHHAVCKGCGKIEPVNVNEHQLITDVETQSHFTIQKHIVEFFGLCPTCK
ncbi:transcriptional repressor [Candidatus Woesebacteria bacterium]|jgi:Fe2+ or Zn2+ uptake regulation protein|nr:transcriptional repressor [Candidatus Woesebacteria bacterium]